MSCSARVFQLRSLKAGKTSEELFKQRIRRFLEAEAQIKRLRHDGSLYSEFWCLYNLRSYLRQNPHGLMRSISPATQTKALNGLIISSCGNI